MNKSQLLNAARNFSNRYLLKRCTLESSNYLFESSIHGSHRCARLAALVLASIRVGGRFDILVVCIALAGAKRAFINQTDEYQEKYARAVAKLETRQLRARQEEVVTTEPTFDLPQSTQKKFRLKNKILLLLMM